MIWTTHFISIRLNSALIFNRFNNFLFSFSSIVNIWIEWSWTAMTQWFHQQNINPFMKEIEQHNQKTKKWEVAVVQMEEHPLNFSMEENWLKLKTLEDVGSIPISHFFIFFKTHISFLLFKTILKNTKHKNVFFLFRGFFGFWDLWMFLRSSFPSTINSVNFHVHFHQTQNIKHQLNRKWRKENWQATAWWLQACTSILSMISNI